MKKWLFWKRRKKQLLWKNICSENQFRKTHRFSSIYNVLLDLFSLQLCLLSFLKTIYIKILWHGKTRLTSYELLVTSYELRVESLKARVEIQKHVLKFKITSWNSNPRVTSSNPRVASWNRWVTSSIPRVTSSNPRVQELLNH